jgi:hypothetical protein
MAQNWANEGLSYACPPLGMVGDVLELLSEQKARAVLVTPFWPQQPWWPSLQRMMVEAIALGSDRKVFCTGPSGVCAPHKNPNWEFWAVEVDGSEKNRNNS